MFHRLNSLVLRIWLLAGLSVVLVTLLIVGTTQLLFDRSVDRSLDAHLAAFTDLLASGVRIDAGAVVLSEKRELFDRIPRHWQISVGGTVEYRSPKLQSDMPLVVASLDSPQRVRHVDSDGTAILAVQSSFLYPEDVVVTMTFGLREDVAKSFRDQEKQFLQRFVYRLLVAVVAVLVALAVLVTTVVTRPLRRISGSLQKIRTGENQRIEQRFPSEIQELAEELNKLLEFLSGALRRHRTFSANIAHALKTPLTVIKNESDTPLVQERVNAMLGVIDRNLARASSAGSINLLSARTDVASVVERILDGFGKVYNCETEWHGDEKTQFLGDEADLFELLGNVIENACKFGRSRVRVVIGAEAVVVEDDGSGISEAERGTVLSWGSRLDESTPGTGIGLAIAKDLAELYQGSIKLGSSELGGLKASVYLPLSS